MLQTSSLGKQMIPSSGYCFGSSDLALEPGLPRRVETRPKHVDTTRYLMGAVYEDLRSLAGQFLATESEDHILQPTALVHEAYTRLSQENIGWNNLDHFKSTAARTMRRVLVDYARRSQAEKRGAGEVHVSHNEELHLCEEAPCLIAIDEAMNELREMDPRQCNVVELRFFGGLNLDECALALGVSKRTISNDWNMARAWLYSRLKDDVGTCD